MVDGVRCRDEADRYAAAYRERFGGPSHAWLRSWSAAEEECRPLMQALIGELVRAEKEAGAGEDPGE